MGLGKLKEDTKVSSEKYLEFERQADERHEFIDGEVYAMAGETENHSKICWNVSGETYNQLKGKDCYGFSPNMKVQSGHYFKQKKTSKGLFSYPDFVVACGKSEFFDETKDVLLNPKVIFEVISPSTEAFDRGEKFSRYRAWNPTLTDYVLIWQIAPIVEHFQRQPDNRWLLTIVEQLEGVLTIESIGCSLKLSDIYNRVEFEDTETDELAETN